MPTANPYTNGLSQNGFSRNGGQRGGNDRFSGVNPQLQAVYERQAATAQARAQAQQRAAQTRPQQPQTQQRPNVQQAPFQQTPSPQPAQPPPKQGEQKSSSVAQFSPELIARLQEQARVEDEQYAASKNGANLAANLAANPAAASAPAMPSIMPPPSSPPVEPPKTSAASDVVAQFAQNERNGGVFYGYLAEKAQLLKHKSSLKSIAANCRENCSRHMELHKTLTQMVPNVAENPINDGVAFAAGLKWALEEEAKALSALADLRESVEGAQLKNNVASIMFRKMSDIAMLQSILLFS